MTRKIRLLFGLSGGLLCSSLALAQEPAKPPAPGQPGVAAYIDDTPVTMAELDDAIVKTNMKFAQQLYDARKAALDQIILQRAFEKDAADKKVPVDEIVKAKVAEKARPVTDEEIKAFFDANLPQMRGQPLEKMSAQIKAHLAEQRETEARSALLAEVRGPAKVKVLIDAPRTQVAVAANDPSKGPADARVTLVEFSEFQ